MENNSFLKNIIDIVKRVVLFGFVYTCLLAGSKLIEVRPDLPTLILLTIGISYIIIFAYGRVTSNLEAIEKEEQGL